MDKIDITQFTDEKNNIQPKKLGDYIIKQEHIAHIKPTKDSTTTDALSTPLYSYNTKYGVYSELTHTSTAPLRNMIYRYTGDLEVPMEELTILSNTLILPPLYFHSLKTIS